MAEKTHGSFYEEREQIILDLLQKKDVSQLLKQQN